MADVMMLHKYNAFNTQNTFPILFNRERTAKTFANSFFAPKQQYMKQMTLNSLLTGHAGCVNTVAWNDSGTLLVSGSDDTQLKIWTDPMGPTMKHINIDTLHIGNIFCGLFLPESGDSKVVSCAADPFVRLFDVNTQKCIASFKSHNNTVHKLAVDYTNPNVFLSASNDGTCREFDIRTPDTSFLLGDLRKPKLIEVNSISINPVNPNFFILGGGDMFLRLYDRRRPDKPIRKIVPPSIADRLGAASSQDTFAFPIHITSVCYNYNGTLALATYSCDEIYSIRMDDASLVDQVLAQDRQKQDKQQLFNSSTSNLEAVDNDIGKPASPEAVLSDDNDENWEDVDEEKDNEDDDEEEALQMSLNQSAIVYQKYSGHRNVRTVKEVRFMGPKSEFVISGSDCGHIFIWETHTGKVVNILRGDKHIVNCLAPKPTHEPILATSGIDYDIKVWTPECKAVEHPVFKTAKNHNALCAQNREMNRQGHNMFALPTSVMLQLMNLVSDGEELEAMSPEDEEDDDDELEGGRRGDDEDDDDGPERQRLRRDCNVM